MLNLRSLITEIMVDYYLHMQALLAYDLVIPVFMCTVFGTFIERCKVHQYMNGQTLLQVKNHYLTRYPVLCYMVHELVSGAIDMATPTPFTQLHSFFWSTMILHVNTQSVQFTGMLRGILVSAVPIHKSCWQHYDYCMVLYSTVGTTQPQEWVSPVVSGHLGIFRQSCIYINRPKYYWKVSVNTQKLCPIDRRGNGMWH